MASVTTSLSPPSPQTLSSMAFSPCPLNSSKHSSLLQLCMILAQDLQPPSPCRLHSTVVWSPLQPTVSPHILSLYAMAVFIICWHWGLFQLPVMLPGHCLWASFLGLSIVWTLMVLCCAVLHLWLVVRVPVPHLFQPITRAWLRGSLHVMGGALPGPSGPAIRFYFFTHAPLGMTMSETRWYRGTSHSLALKWILKQ